MHYTCTLRLCKNVSFAYGTRMTFSELYIVCVHAYSELYIHVVCVHAYSELYIHVVCVHAYS